MDFEKINKVREGFLGLNDHESQVVIGSLLNEGKINFVVLAESYVRHLEGRAADNSRTISKAGLWISSYWNDRKGYDNRFLKAASAYWMIRTGVIAGSGMERDVKEFLEKNPYEEDKNGFPVSDIR